MPHFWVPPCICWMKEWMNIVEFLESCRKNYVYISFRSSKYCKPSLEASQCILACARLWLTSHRVRNPLLQHSTKLLLPCTPFWVSPTNILQNQYPSWERLLLAMEVCWWHFGKGMTPSDFQAILCSLLAPCPLQFPNFFPGPEAEPISSRPGTWHLGLTWKKSLYAGGQVQEFVTRRTTWRPAMWHPGLSHTGHRDLQDCIIQSCPRASLLLLPNRPPHCRMYALRDIVRRECESAC